jgi:hypothetical protein
LRALAGDAGKAARTESILNMTSRLRMGLLLLILAEFAPGRQPRQASIDLALEERDIQKAVDSQFPVTKEAFPVRLTLRDLRVRLREGEDRVGLSLEVEARLPIIAPLRGRIAASGVPRYDAAQKAFFLSEPVLERLELPGVAERELDLINTAVGTLAAPVLESTPIYTLRDRTLQERAARYLLQEISIQGGKLYLRLGPPDEGVAPTIAPIVIIGGIAGLLAAVLVNWRLRTRRRRK